MSIKKYVPSVLRSPVTFYVQASSQVGLGHLSRSAALIRGLAKNGITSLVCLDADALGYSEAKERGLNDNPDLPSGPGPVVIDALYIPPTNASWLTGFSPRILISPVCNRADLATHALVRESPDALRAALPHASELIIDPAFAFVTAEGLSPRLRSYSSLTLGICLSGGDDPFDMNILLGAASRVTGLREVRILDRRRLNSLPENMPKLMQASQGRNPWDFLGTANVFLGGEGVMLAEAIAQGIPVISLSQTGKSSKNSTLADTGSIKFIPRHPFDPTCLTEILNDRDALSEMHKSALRSVSKDFPSSLVLRIADILTVRR